MGTLALCSEKHNGATESQTKFLIGEASWDEFVEWMNGQTVGICLACGVLYYIHDIERFIRSHA